MKQVYKASGIDCANCATKLENQIKKVNGVSFVVIDFIGERLTIDATDEAMIKVKELCSNFEDGVTLKRIK
ncbi:MAG: cation transporter [Bacilli bacterium]|nr:cation transporter [Bacilli bacterium]